MKGLVVCVDFWDLLAITLPRNAGCFDEVLVVTTLGDQRTMSVVGSGPANVNAYCTEVFSANGATFNKGAAIEEGLDVLGREDWLCVFDADIVMPPEMDLAGIQSGYLYAPRRRNLADPRQWAKYLPPGLWRDLPLAPDLEHGGYFHLFHASDPALGSPPWYATNWRHAGGYDSDFIMHWPREKHLRLPFEVLHLGEDGKNWWGRVTPYLDGSRPDSGEVARQRMAQMWVDRKQRGGIRKEKL